MKTFKKILIIVYAIIIAVGIFMLVRSGLNYYENYTQHLLLETTKQYTLYIGISTAIILIYFAIRYYKKGVLKVLLISILGIVGTIIFVLAIMAILRMPITRLFFPIMLGSYVASIVAISAYFEENT